MLQIFDAELSGTLIRQKKISSDRVRGWATADRSGALGGARRSGSAGITLVSIFYYYFFIYRKNNAFCTSELFCILILLITHLPISEQKGMTNCENNYR